MITNHRAFLSPFHRPATSFGLVLAVLLASALPAPGQGGWLTLANPHWNITLTDAGYSDFLLDNTPGFEGREYLSGEWGAAVGYQPAGGAVVRPSGWNDNSSFRTGRTTPRSTSSPRSRKPA
jgi:hypothetical protein